MLISQGSLLFLETFDQAKLNKIEFLFTALRYFSLVAEILATENFEINVFLQVKSLPYPCFNIQLYLTLVRRIPFLAV